MSLPVCFLTGLHAGHQAAKRRSSLCYSKGQKVVQCSEQAQVCFDSPTLSRSHSSPYAVALHWRTSLLSCQGSLERLRMKERRRRMCSFSAGPILARGLGSIDWTKLGLSKKSSKTVQFAKPAIGQQRAHPEDMVSRSRRLSSEGSRVWPAATTAKSSKEVPLCVL